MNSSAPIAIDSPAHTADEIAVLSNRVQAVEMLTEMAAGGAVRLLGHLRQLEGAIEQISGPLDALPEATRIHLLAERMESMQAMLDWLTTRAAPGSEQLKNAELQARLSMCRITFVSLQAELQQATTLVRCLREARETLAGLAGKVETIETARARAESLLRKSRTLSANLAIAIGTDSELSASA